MMNTAVRVNQLLAVRHSGHMGSETIAFWYINEFMSRSMEAEILITLSRLLIKCHKIQIPLCFVLIMTTFVSQSLSRMWCCNNYYYYCLLRSLTTQMVCSMPVVRTKHHMISHMTAVIASSRPPVRQSFPPSPRLPERFQNMMVSLAIIGRYYYMPDQIVQIS